MLTARGNRINPNFPHTAVQYLVADITGFVQLIMAKELFKDFPALRFIVPHAGGLYLARSAAGAPSRNISTGRARTQSSARAMCLSIPASITTSI